MQLYITSIVCAYTARLPLGPVLGHPFWPVQRLQLCSTINIVYLQYCILCYLYTVFPLCRPNESCTVETASSHSPDDVIQPALEPDPRLPPLQEPDSTVPKSIFSADPGPDNHPQSRLEPTAVNSHPVNSTTRPAQMHEDVSPSSYTQSKTDSFDPHSTVESFPMDLPFLLLPLKSTREDSLQYFKTLKDDADSPLMDENI